MLKQTERPFLLTLEGFLTWAPNGRIAAGRKARYNPEWGSGVWWSDRFGICSEIVATTGGPLGYEKEQPNTLAEA